MGSRLLHPLRSLSLTLQVAIVAGFAVVVVTLAFVFSFVAIERLRHAAEDARHAEDVIAASSATEKLVLDLETGVRGYAITGRQSFLQPTVSARNELPAAERRLRSLLAGDPVATRQEAAIEREVDDYVKNWTTPVIAVAGRDLGQARKIVGEGGGRRRVDKLRADFASLVAGRAQLADERRDRADDAGRAAIEIGGVSFAAILLLVLVFVVYFAKAAVLPVSRVAGATRRLAAGEQGVRVPEEGTGEVGVLARGFNAMAATLEENREHLEREQRLSEARYNFGRRIAAMSDLEPLAQVILSGIAELTKFDAGAVYLISESGRSLRLAAWLGVDEDELPERLRIDDPRQVLDVGVPELQAVFEHGGSTIGFVAVARTSGEPTASDEIVEVERLAEQSAVAVAHALALRRTRRLLDVNRAVLDSTREGITMVDLNGRLLFSNRAMEGFYASFGVPAEGTVWERLLETADRTTTPERYVADFARVIDDPDLVYENEFTIAESGATFSGITAPVKDSAGRLIGRIFSLRDVSAEREADRLQEEFVATVSHELRTPLTSMFGFMEVLLDGDAGELNEEQRRFLQIVQRSTERLMRLVGDLLIIGQIDSGHLSLEAAPTDLRSVAEDVVESARALARVKGIELNLNVEPVALISADRARLVQLTDNLLSNALKFTPEGGRIEVSVSEQDGKCVLEVSDSGLGIPKAERGRLFERFFRTSEATERAIPGTGLGLAISRAIVEAHGGVIDVVDRDGPGATFRVELPLIAGAAPAPPVSAP